MVWPFHNKSLAGYWLKVFGFYALFEAFIQLLFNFLLNTYGAIQISNLEFHAVMWLFQCLLIWPIWWVAYSVHKKNVGVQVLINLTFFIVYTYLWFGPVQDGVQWLHDNLQQLTLSSEKRLATPVDTPDFIHYQLLKHAFRLSWFYLANYLYHYRREESQRVQLAVANKELQLKLLKWHLNPAFYFKTIDHFRELAAQNPVSCTRPILQLAKVMEYVIYEAKEKTIDVSKEINFLHDYVQLINQQPGHTARFAIETEGTPGKLKIAPLLLAGFIDKITASSSNNARKLYALHLKFTGNEMRFSIHGDMNGHGNAFFGEVPDTLYRRFSELYPGRFSVNQSEGKDFFELNVKLDEQ